MISVGDLLAVLDPIVDTTASRNDTPTPSQPPTTMVPERTFSGPLTEAAPTVSPPWTDEESLELALNGINGFEGTSIQS